MSVPSLLVSCQVIAPLSNSDHLGIIVETKLRCPSKPARHPSRTVWHYSHADWDQACERIEAFDWDNIITEDINSSWDGWHAAFLNIMEKCIPRKALHSKSNLPWLNKQIKSAMRKRNGLFKITGYSANFRSARNKVTDLLRKAKANYFKNLNPKDSKKFCKTVKYLTKQQSLHFNKGV